MDFGLEKQVPQRYSNQSRILVAIQPNVGEIVYYWKQNYPKKLGNWKSLIIDKEQWWQDKSYKLKNTIAYKELPFIMTYKPPIYLTEYLGSKG